MCLNLIHLLFLSDLSSFSPGFIRYCSTIDFSHEIDYLFQWKFGYSLQCKIKREEYNVQENE